MDKIFSDNKTLARLFLLMATAPLVLALASQYLFGLKPCELCVFQRIPYMAIILFSFLAIKRPRLKIFLFSAIMIIHAFLIDAGIAFYHIGVEKHWWIHGNCASTLNMDSIEALRASILATPAVRCDDIQFELLGLSMAGWNFIYALCAGIFSIYALAKFIKLRSHETK